MLDVHVFFLLCFLNLNSVKQKFQTNEEKIYTFTYFSCSSFTPEPIFYKVPHFPFYWLFFSLLSVYISNQFFHLSLCLFPSSLFSHLFFWSLLHISQIPRLISYFTAALLSCLSSPHILIPVSISRSIYYYFFPQQIFFSFWCEAFLWSFQHQSNSNLPVPPSLLETLFTARFSSPLSLRLHSFPLYPPSMSDFNILT